MKETIKSYKEKLGDSFDGFDYIDWDDLRIWQAYMTEETFEKYSIDYPCVRECCGYGSGKTKLEAIKDLYEDLKKNNLIP